MERTMISRRNHLMNHAISIQLAQHDDLPEIIAFLSRSEVDGTFCRPLSDRRISIAERVALKDQQGVWAYAELYTRMVSCMAIAPKEKSAEFSNFACINDLNSKIAGAALWEHCLKLAKYHFNASFIEIDSWQGNAFIQRFLSKRGFEKRRV